MKNADSMDPEDINFSSELVFIYDIPKKEILFSNRPLESFFEPFDIQIAPFHLKNFDNGLISEWEKCLQLKEKETYNFSSKIILTDGTPVCFNFYAVGMSLPSLSHRSLLHFFVQRTIAKQSASLHGKDYAEFIDLAVHDLDAPLRKLSFLTERLTHQTYNGPANEIDDYLKRIQTNLADMRLIIESLSTLFKINSSVSKRISLNTENMLDEVLRRWVERLKKKNISISISPLPKLLGDSHQCKQMFSNILDNAIKFSKQTAGRIDVYSDTITTEEKIKYKLEQPGRYAKIVVADDGIGFRKEYAEKIFQPFVRLNGKMEYPGSGMGLAICHKVAENNNGIIYAEGDEDKGSRFIIILPQSFD